MADLLGTDTLIESQGVRWLSKSVLNNKDKLKELLLSELCGIFLNTGSTQQELYGHFSRMPNPTVFLLHSVAPDVERLEGGCQALKNYLDFWKTFWEEWPGGAEDRRRLFVFLLLDCSASHSKNVLSWLPRKFGKQSQIEEFQKYLDGPHRPEHAVSLNKLRGPSLREAINWVNSVDQDNTADEHFVKSPVIAGLTEFYQMLEPKEVNDDKEPVIPIQDVIDRLGELIRRYPLR